LPGLGAEDPALGEFFERIRSDDDDVRMQARLAAANWGIAALAGLAKVQEGEHHQGAITARAAIARIVHFSARPGVDAERRRCAQALTALTTTAWSPEVRRDALGHLRLIGGDSEMDAVAACLDDGAPHVAEAARLCLEGLPGDGATRALLRAVEGDNADPDLVFSLGKRPGGETTERLVVLSASERPEVGFAALQALAHSGAEAGVSCFQRAFVEAAEPLRQRLFTEYLRLADELYDAGRREVAGAIYGEALRDAPRGFQRERALLRLLPAGGTATMDHLLVALGDVERRVRVQALGLLGGLRGSGVTETLRAEFARADDVVKPALLQALAAYDAEAAKAEVTQAAAAEDRALRVAAQVLLGRVEDASEGDYWKVANDPSARVRAEALGAYLSLAERRLAAAKSDDAMAMFLRGLEAAADEPSLRRRALAGLVAVGNPAAIDGIAPFLRDSVVSRAAADAFVLFASSLAEQGGIERADVYFQKVLTGAFPSDLVQVAVERLAALGRDPRQPARQQGFLLEWWFVGPMSDKGKGMETPLFPESRVRLDTVEEIGPRRYRWKKMMGLALTGKVDLLPEFRRSQRVVAYAYTTFESTQERDVLFHVGSDDGIACFLNGERILFAPEPRAYRLDQDVAPGRLVAGKNEILLKTANVDGVWEFSVRVTDPTGKPLDD